MYRRCIVFVTSICKYTHHTVLQSTQPHPIPSPHKLLVILHHQSPVKIMKYVNLVISYCLAVSWSELKLGWLCRGQFRSAGQWWAWLNLHRRHVISKHLYRYNFITTEDICASYWSRRISGNETRGHDSIANIVMVSILLLFLSILYLVFRIWATNGTMLLSSTDVESLIWKHEERKLIIV